MEFKPFAAAVGLTATLCLGLSVPARAEATQQTADFVHRASEGNMFEIETSKLALTKSSVNDVKNFALTMVTDHTGTGDQLKKVLASSGTGLAPADKLEDEHQKTLNGLKAVPPASFDGLYIQAQGKAHDDAVSLFTSYAENGDDTELKKFAADTLPALKKHQDMLHSLSTYMSSRQ